MDRSCADPSRCLFVVPCRVFPLVKGRRVDVCTMPQTRRNSRSLCCCQKPSDERRRPKEDPDEVAKRLETLDREFREMKEQVKHQKNVHVFTVDDYELDPRGLEWDRKFRGRDVENLREALAKREKPPGFPSVPLEQTDLFSEEEIESFKERASTIDPVGNIVWHDPMPESDFDITLDNSHFRDTSHVNGETDPDTQRFLYENALPDKTFASEAEQLAEYARFYDDIEIEEFWDEKPCTFQDNTPVPPPDKLKRWQEAAEARGGNATVGESYKLHPTKHATEFDTSLERERTASYGSRSGLEVPPQHRILHDIHKGKWIGVARVFSIPGSANDIEPSEAPEQGSYDSSGGTGDDRNGSTGGGDDGWRGANKDSDSDSADDVDRPSESSNGGPNQDTGAESSSSPLKDLSGVDLPQAQSIGNEVVVTTAVQQKENGDVQWISSVVSESVSRPIVTFPCRDSSDALCPGRTVFSDGSYVLEQNDVIPYDETETVPDEDDPPSNVAVEVKGPSVFPGLTVSDDLFRAIIKAAGVEDSENIGGIVELCIMHDGAKVRQRVIIGNKFGELSNVVVICEAYGDDDHALSLAKQLFSRKATYDALVGSWTGTGISLHPLCPPCAISEMCSRLEFEKVERPPDPRVLTYLREDLSSMKAATAAQVSPASVRPREKLSRRVIRALERDEARLSRCSHVSCEVLQGFVQERHAWEVTKTGLFSPRLGHGVPDYFAMPLPGGVILVTVIGAWAPGVRGRVELIDCACPTRKRIIGSKSGEGEVTGTALLTENKE